MAVLILIAVGSLISTSSAAATAVLTPVPGSPFRTGTEPGSAEFSPSGALLATANNAANTISVFSVGSGGVLAQVPGSPFSTADTPDQATFSPSGALLAVTYSQLNGVGMYSIGSGGALTEVPGSLFGPDQGGSVEGIAFSPSGQLLAGVGSYPNGVYMSSIGSDGALTPIPGSPFDDGSGPYTLSFSSSGALLATANTYGDTVSMYSAAPDGVLTPVPGSPFPVGDYAGSVGFSPSGSFLAVAGAINSDTVSVFSVGSDGSLTPVPGSPFQNAGLTSGSVAFSPSGALLAVANQGGDGYPGKVSVFSVESNGALTPAAGSPFTAGADPTSVAFSPSGALLATANADDSSVSVFSVGQRSLPADIDLPTVGGSKRAKGQLRCSTGAWTNSPTGFAYQWSDDGSPVSGATKAVYMVPVLEEGTKLTCTVTASNAAGTGTATSHGVKIPVPVVPRCPGATGQLTESMLGLVTLGATRSQEHRLYRHHADRGTRYEDFFCLTPIGVRVGYGSPKLLRVLNSRAKRRLENKVVWASTSNPFYSIDGVRPGESITRAAAVLHTLSPLHIGRNYWYLAVRHASTKVLKVRGGVVDEIGIATHELSATTRDRDALMHSFY